jgi:2-methylcitrate dehydratase PrpD
MRAPDSAAATRMLAEYVARPAGEVPAACLQLARTAMLDTVGVALAAAAEPTVTTLAAEFPAAGGPCTVWVGGGHTTADQAALLNGTAAHALDYDDVDDLVAGHPSAVLVPTVLAVAERTRASGALATEAYWRGLVVMRALAAGIGISAHYGRGWHATSTLGVVAAAAAAGTVLGLSADQVGHALGLAVSRAAGTRQNFGSMTKPLHAGLAAADGVRAASLARRGFTAGRDPIDGAYGLLSLYAGGPVPTAAQRAEAAEVLVATCKDPGRAALNVKLFPCCYATHAAADAALDLAVDIDVDDIDAVTVVVPERGLQPLNSSPPRTGLEGKFNMAHVVACCLVDGRLGFDAFTDAGVERPKVRDLAGRVTSSETLDIPATEGLAFAAEVAVRTRDGATTRMRCDGPRGHADRQASSDDVLAKFAECVAFGGTAVPADLGARLHALPERASVAGLFTPRVRAMITR